MLKRAVLDAVYFAGERKRATYLQYFEANATFLVADREGKVLATHKIYEDLTDEIRENEDLMPKTTFRAIGPLSGSDGGRTEYDEDHLELTRVYYVGCSIPFHTEILGETIEMSFDPFSGYILGEDEE